MQTTRFFRQKGLAKVTAQKHYGLLATRRPFTNAPCLNEQTTETIETASTEAADTEQAPEEPVRLSRRRRRFHEWAKASGARFSRAAEGTTNYISSTPFPNNPLFQPRPPLSDARRQQIYDTYKSDPENESIRKLATQFDISMRRVEAVIKLKEAENEFQMNGIPLQTHFAKGMEKLMGAAQSDAVLQEPLVDIFPNVKKPTFAILEEDASFEAKDAAKFLNRKLYTDLEQQAIAAEEASFANKKSAITNVETKVARRQFVFVDTSA